MKKLLEMLLQFIHVLQFKFFITYFMVLLFSSQKNPTLCSHTT